MDSVDVALNIAFDLLDVQTPPADYEDLKTRVLAIYEGLGKRFHETSAAFKESLRQLRVSTRVVGRILFSQEIFYGLEDVFKSEIYNSIRALDDDVTDLLQMCPGSWRIATRTPAASPNLGDNQNFEDEFDVDDDNEDFDDIHHFEDDVEVENYNDDTEENVYVSDENLDLGDHEDVEDSYEDLGDNQHFEDDFGVEDYNQDPEDIVDFHGENIDLGDHEDVENYNVDFDDDSDEFEDDAGVHNLPDFDPEKQLIVYKRDGWEVVTRPVNKEGKKIYYPPDFLNSSIIFRNRNNDILDYDEYRRQYEIIDGYRKEGEIWFCDGKCNNNKCTVKGQKNYVLGHTKEFSFQCNLAVADTSCGLQRFRKNAATQHIKKKHFLV